MNSEMKEVVLPLEPTSTSLPSSTSSRRKNSALHFRHVNYTMTQTAKTSNSPQQNILKDVSGAFRSGHLTAILGPSGAGKTTLLNVLAGFKTKNVSGEFSLYGEALNELDKLRPMSSYIPQDFVMLHLLSVMETLRSAADLKLPRSTTETRKQEIITHILMLLNLQDCQNTLVQYLSGGERKRLSIGIELVTNPPLMFFDEPTSGLDSLASLQVIEYLKNLAHGDQSHGGRIIVCVIHSPSSRLMQLFDDVVVMCHGEILYCGSQHELLPYFAQVNDFICPAYYNPADYVIEVSSNQRHSDHEYLIEQNKKLHNINWTGDDTTKDIIDSVSCEQLKIKDSRNSTEVPIGIASPKENEEQLHISTFKIHKITVFQQFLLLLNRSFRSLSRHLLGVQLRIAMHIVAAILLGVVFWDIGNDGSKVLTNFSCIFFLAMFIFYANAMPSILLCPQDMGVFLREYLNGWYKLHSYYLAKITSELPMLLICPTCFITIVYFMSGQHNDVARYVMCWGVGLLIGVIGHLIGLIFGSTFGEQMAIFLIPATTLPFLLFSGFLIRIDEMIRVLRPVCDISFFRYAVEGFVQAIYGYDRPDLPCPEDRIMKCFYTSPSSFLSDLSMWGDFYGRDIAALLTWILLLLVLFYLSLCWSIKRAR